MDRIRPGGGLSGRGGIFTPAETWNAWMFGIRTGSVNGSRLCLFTLKSQHVAPRSGRSEKMPCEPSCHLWGSCRCNISKDGVPADRHTRCASRPGESCPSEPPRVGNHGRWNRAEVVSEPQTGSSIGPGLRLVTNNDFARSRQISARGTTKSHANTQDMKPVTTGQIDQLADETTGGAARTTIQARQHRQEVAQV